MRFNPIKFINDKVQENIKKQALAVLSDPEIISAFNEVVRQIALEALEDTKKGFEKK
jgi:hypothetical protein